MDRYVEFPQAAGKTMKAAAFFTSPEFRALTLRFEDGTDLTIEIRLGFVAEAVFSDWKTGNRRIIKRWPNLRSEERA